VIAKRASSIASLSALTSSLLDRKRVVEEAHLGHGSEEASVGKGVAVPMRMSATSAGFEPEALAGMSEASDATREVFARLRSCGRSHQ
jgi:hypothetical protein